MSIYKFNFNFLDHQSQVSTQILLNSLSLFEKDVKIPHTKRIIFPNVKVKVKMSDGLIIKAKAEKTNILPISFTLDHINSGEMSTMSVWLRNESRIKVGEL